MTDVTNRLKACTLANIAILAVPSMPIVRTSSGGLNRRQQHGWLVGSMMAMCIIAIAMDSGGGNGQQWKNGNLMGVGDGDVIAMGDGGSGAMDNRTAA
jgi:hypothetical protein